MYVVVSSISLAACLFLVFTYIRYKPLQKFPSNIILWRTICDMGVSAATMITNWPSSTVYVCNESVAFLTQGALIGSTCWYACLGFSLYKSVSNPFVRTESYNTKFHAFTWLLVLITGSVVANNVEFRPELRMCWTTNAVGLNLSV